MFKKSFSLILLITGLVLFLSACSPLGGHPAEPFILGDELGGFVGGIIGLDVNVLNGAPPSVIQDAGLTPFSFVVSLENVGEASVGAGTDNPLVLVRLAGIMYKNFGLSENTAAQTLVENRKESFHYNHIYSLYQYLEFYRIYQPFLY